MDARYFFPRNSNEYHQKLALGVGLLLLLYLVMWCRNLWNCVDVVCKDLEMIAKEAINCCKPSFMEGESHQNTESDQSTE